MTTVHSIKNIKDIAILAYNGNISYVPAEIFIDCINLGGGINRDMGNSSQKCSGWDTMPQNAYKITNHDKLSGNSSGSKFNKGEGAPHDDDNKYYSCTKYWNLFSDDRMTIEKQKLYDNKFKKFNDDNNARENWIGNEDGRYSSSEARDFRLFWRVYYRTWYDYYDIIKCGKDNLELNSYNNNQECKNNIQNNNWSYLSNACLKLSDDKLFSEACNDAVTKDDIINRNKIMKKRMEYCKDNKRIIDNKNCKIFVNNALPNNMAERDKTDLDTWVINTLCGSGSNPNDKNFVQPNQEFCACVNEIRPDKRVEYRDANDLNGSIKTISGVCNTEDCQNNINTYKLLQNKSILESCPKNICIQNQALTNLISAKNISQQCNIQSNTDTTTITNNPIKVPEPPKVQPELPINNPPKVEVDNSLTKTISKEIDNLLPGVFPIQITDTIKFNQIHFLILIIAILYYIFSLNQNTNNSNYYPPPYYY